MASKMFDFPLPFKPVMELKLSSLRDISARHAPGERGIVYLPSRDDRPHSVRFKALTLVRVAFVACTRALTSMITSMTLILADGGCSQSPGAGCLMMLKWLRACCYACPKLRKSTKTILAVAGAGVRMAQATICHIYTICPSFPLFSYLNELCCPVFAWHIE